MHKMITSVPTRKIQAGTLTGALVVVLTWLLGLFEIELPVEVAVAIGTVMSFVVAYYVPPAPQDQIMEVVPNEA